MLIAIIIIRDANYLFLITLFAGSWGGGKMEDYAKMPRSFHNKTSNIAWVNSNCGKCL